jgi:peptidoglycan/LPS O-acetylase OafA/YrhL
MQQTSRAYVPAIDGLRAIAVLAVIIFHAGSLQVLPGGFAGVDMFFVISGYVISQSLSGRAHLGFAAYMQDFYRRRFLRILPALLLVLLVSFVVSAMFVPAIWLSEQNNRTGLAAFAGLSNFILAWNTNTYFSPAGELNPYLHTWSLGVEEQFYVLFPLIYFAWLRLGKQSWLARAVLPLLAMVSLSISAWQTQADPRSAFYLLPGRFWELAAGAMLFQLIDTGHLARMPRRLVSRLLPVGFVLVAAGFLFSKKGYFPFPWALVTVAGTVLMIAAVVLRNGPATALHRVLQSRVVTYIGRLSFSLYLWHWPVIVFLRWTTGTELLAVQLAYPVVVLALAAASYHWVETPLRRGKLASQRRAWMPLASGVAAACVFAYAASWITQNPDVLAMGKTQDTYTWQARKHYPREPVQPIDDARAKDRQIFAMGDSHTAAYRTMLKIVSLKFDAQVIEYEGCSVVTLMAADRTDCAPFRETALKDIEARAKPGDIVFLASLRMPELAGRDWTRGEDAAFGEAQSELTAQNTDAARRSAQDVLRRLEAARVRVLIEAPIPLYKAPPNRCSDWFNATNPVCAPGLTVERSRIQQLRAPQLELVTSLQREHPGLRVWDPLPILCPGTTCSAYDASGDPLYFDADHLSGHGNRVLEPSFSDTILAIWRE